MPRWKPYTERFFENFIPEPNSGCWLWLGSLNEDGYGHIRVNTVTTSAHRCSWLIHQGVIPPGMNILHKCDVRCCVNPTHLYIGTQVDNIRDMMDRKRHLIFVEPDKQRKILDDARPASVDATAGGKAWCARLDWQKVREIRVSEESDRDLAQRYGVWPFTIYKVRNNISWRER